MPTRPLHPGTWLHSQEAVTSSGAVDMWPENVNPVQPRTGADGIYLERQDVVRVGKNRLFIGQLPRAMCAYVIHDAHAISDTITMVPFTPRVDQKLGDRHITQHLRRLSDIAILLCLLGSQAFLFEAPVTS